ncbi:2'-5' RNA ligase family protein [Microlunatus endophyticus]|uniref:2'-5' RNA ligase family protein n=1 Tax=Microlunatus endophyticus TaxID=1716077 RepID=UPI00166B5291|nr:2'-5' RNA ligase family protein [Microlunatus endophyticus]
MDSAVLLTFDELRVVVDPFRRESLLPGGGGLSLAEVIPPHMTVASPACPEPVSELAGGRLREAVEGLHQFSLRFSEVGTFRQGTVFIAPDRSADLDRLLARVGEGFAEFGGVRRDHVWHLSVARRGGAQLAARFRASFEPVIVTVASVSIWTQEVAGSPWSLRHAVRLADPAR